MKHLRTNIILVAFALAFLSIGVLAPTVLAQRDTTLTGAGGACSIGLNPAATNPNPNPNAFITVGITNPDGTVNIGASGIAAVSCSPGSTSCCYAVGVSLSQFTSDGNETFLKRIDYYANALTLACGQSATVTNPGGTSYNLPPGYDYGVGTFVFSIDCSTRNPTIVTGETVYITIDNPQ